MEAVTKGGVTSGAAQIRAAWTQYSVVLAGILLVLVVGILVVWPLPSGILIEHLILPGYEHTFGFRGGRVRMTTRGQTYTGYAIVEVTPGGWLDRAGVRAGDIPVEYHGGMWAFYGALRRAQGGAPSSFDVVASSDWGDWSRSRSITLPERVRDHSLRVFALNGFGMGSRGWWILDIHADGTATLDGDHLLEKRRFSIPASRMAELRAALAASDLEGLSRHHYGTHIIDRTVCMLTVMRGDRTYFISLSRFLDGPPTAAERRDVREALDLWKATKGVGGILELPDVCTDMLKVRSWGKAVQRKTGPDEDCPVEPQPSPASSRSADTGWYAGRPRRRRRSMTLIGVAILGLFAARGEAGQPSKAERFVYWEDLTESQRTAVLARPRVSADAVAFYRGELTPSDDERTFRLLDTLSSRIPKDASIRALHFHAFNRILAKADGVLAEVMGPPCARLLLEEPEYVVAYLQTHDSLRQEYADSLGSEFAGGRSPELPYDFVSFKSRVSARLGRRSDLQPTLTELFDKIAAMMRRME